MAPRGGQSWRRIARVLVALLALALPGSPALAADPDPLWDAYPLEQRGETPAAPSPAGTPTPAQRPPGEPLRVRPATASDEGGSAPWLPLLGGLGVLGLGGAVLLRRRRGRGPAAPTAPAAPSAPAPAAQAAPAPTPATPPAPRRAAPLLPDLASERPPARSGRAAGGAVVAAPPRTRVRVECVIAWQPGPGGSRFRALITTPEGEARVVAESTAFWWPVDRPPILTDTTEEAHAGLVEELMGQGWRPTGAGFPWYARRFRRWEGAQDA